MPTKTKTKKNHQPPKPHQVKGRIMPTKTKTKKTYMTVGKLFGKMAEKATFLDYRVLGPGEMEDPPFIGFLQIDELVRFYDDSVCLYDVGTWPCRQRVKVKGRTATFDHGTGYTIQVRFYTIKPVRRLS